METKKLYTKPELDVIQMTGEDVIATSGGVELPGDDFDDE